MEASTVDTIRDRLLVNVRYWHLRFFSTDSDFGIDCRDLHAYWKSLTTLPFCCPATALFKGLFLLLITIDLWLMQSDLYLGCKIDRWPNKMIRFKTFILWKSYAISDLWPSRTPSPSFHAGRPLVRLQRDVFRGGNDRSLNRTSRHRGSSAGNRGVACQVRLHGQGKQPIQYLIEFWQECRCTNLFLPKNFCSKVVKITTSWHRF